MYDDEDDDLDPGDALADELDAQEAEADYESNQDYDY